MDKKNCVGLNKEYKVDIEVGDYENLYVGFEFEFNIVKRLYNFSVFIDGIIIKYNPVILVKIPGS